MYKYQVNFDKVFVDGILSGKRYHDHLRFVSKSDAIFFAKRDGMIITECTRTGSYRQEDSQVIAIEPMLTEKY